MVDFFGQEIVVGDMVLIQHNNGTTEQHFKMVKISKFVQEHYSKNPFFEYHYKTVSGYKVKKRRMSSNCIKLTGAFDLMWQLKEKA